ncbi:MAG: hypothetical protein FE78DRAFT_227246 [Acidomyces sp. 'richmondensis']|nr:MAG: hypothetical protein FE78DRAFT_227246 [Acidomyces sp. 'richmondensis']
MQHVCDGGNSAKRTDLSSTIDRAKGCGYAVTDTKYFTHSRAKRGDEDHRGCDCHVRDLSI